MSEVATLVSDPDFTLLVGDVRDALATLDDESVHCVVTSPPYFGLRDYGTGNWEGGNDPDCNHAVRVDPRTEGSTLGGGKSTTGHQREGYKDECPRCGARRVDRQLGLEATPDEYVANMVEVFREIRRVLRADGTCWLNIGDSYAAGGGFAPDAPSNQARLRGESVGSLHAASGENYMARANGPKKAPPGLKPKDLVGIPWRLAFALQEDGWYLRCDIIWSKPNPMPESVTDRPTRAHEYLFLLTKSRAYFYDADAVREPWTTDHMPGASTNETQHYGAGNGGNTGLTAHRQPFMAAMRESRRPQSETLDGSPGEAPRGPDGRRRTHVQGGSGSLQHRDGDRWPDPTGRNKRSVWEIVTESYPGAHFATFPQALVEPCVLAGTSEKGCCPECGAPWERELERELLETKTRKEHPSSVVRHGAPLGYDGGVPLSIHHTTGWRPTCGHYDALYHRDFPKPRGRWQQMTWWDRVRRRAIPARFGWPTEPAVVLDPFIGSGTTALVARRLGRRCVGVELNAEYADLAATRLQQLSLFG